MHPGKDDIHSPPDQATTGQNRVVEIDMAKSENRWYDKMPDLSLETRNEDRGVLR